MRTSTGRRPGTAATSGHIGHIGHTRREWFYLPVWHQQWRPARLRTVLASTQLRTAASDRLPPTVRDLPSPVAITAARRWLAARGAAGVIRFPIERFGSDNAPERRAMRGHLVHVGI
jgi:CRISPR-associated protein Csb3